MVVKIAFLLLLLAPAVAISHASDCSHARLLVKMTEAKSKSIIDNLKNVAGSDYDVRLVYAMRTFELMPNKVTADRLFELIPESDEDDEKIGVWMALQDVCQGSAIASMDKLDRFGSRMFAILARAALLTSNKLDRYVQFSHRAGWPDSDSAVQLVSVCKKRQKEFSEAVMHLPEDQKFWFMKYTFDPQHCVALRMPEAY